MAAERLESTADHLTRAWGLELAKGGGEPEQHVHDLTHILLQDIVNGHLDDSGPFWNGRRSGVGFITANYKVGFIGAHDGCNACFVFVDFWGNENELFHRVFLSRRHQPQALSAAKISDSSVCVWDLRLQSFERDAWIKHILKKPDAPDFDSYLQERMNGDA